MNLLTLYTFKNEDDYLSLNICWLDHLPQWKTKDKQDRAGRAIISGYRFCFVHSFFCLTVQKGHRPERGPNIETKTPKAYEYTRVII